ncbi:TIR domain-containing protein [Actinotalea solisilvae]|uniref:TIR domain-containing protein n=1 Tax=Actinotalea solisilvae TaxID=2072922 RepID=UPI0018F24FA6|nr:TIR domain-containing protein [Actinotalea solisilvae]
MAGLERRASTFISFASQDEAIARALSAHLEAAGISTFFAPRDIRGGMNFAVEIVRAVASSDAVVVLLSRPAVESPHVRREVSLAIDERRVLLPVALPGTRFPVGFSAEWTYWLSAVQVADYGGPEETLRLLRPMLPVQPQHPQHAESRRAGERTLSDRRRPLRGRSSSPSALLRPDRAVPALVGRETELARLEEWCRRGDEFDVRLMSGGAGQGKSRLARELAGRLEADGWRTAFVPPERDGRAVVIELPPEPTLLVVDYAETRTSQLAALFDAFLEHGVEGTVRMLLLARTAGDWWTTLLARDPDVSDLVSDATVQPLLPLTDDRATVVGLFTTACEQFAAALRLGAPRDVPVPYRAYGSALDVLQDALIAVLGATPEAATGGDRLLAHERRYLGAAARAAGIDEVDDVDLGRVAAALTLYGAATEDEAAQVVQECNRDLEPTVRRRVARLFHRLYPGRPAYVEGVRPDVIGEDLIAGVLMSDGRLPGAPLSRDLGDRSDEQRHRALLTLSRGATRHPPIAAELGRVVRNADVELLLLGIRVATQVEDPGPLLGAIEATLEDRPSGLHATLLSAVPDESVALADLAARLARRAIADIPEESEHTLADVVVAIACSNRFSDAGWTAEAASSVRLAVDRLRRLDAVDRDERVLGTALTNLSNRLWELGALGDALEPAVEAVHTLDGSRATPVERASARSNLAFRLAELGRHSDALAELTIAERMCGAGPGDDAATRAHASIMNNLTCVLLSTGEPLRAAQYGTACVELRRSQALRDRDRFLPNVARALANAAPALEASGDSLLADRLLVEARALHRIAGRRAPIFRFEEAESATLESIILLGRQEWASANRAAEEAQHVLASVQVDLGDLGWRLGTTLSSVLAATEARDSVRVADVAVGAHPAMHLPRLLEYRDL